MSGDYGQHDPYGDVSPRYLYRYRPLSSDTDLDRAEDIALASRFYWASPLEDMNDPFECRPIVELEAKGLKRDRAISRMIERQASPGAAGERRRMKRELKALTASQLNERLERSFALHMSRAGLVCYSEVPSCPIMWGHYASSHTGVCFQFDMRSGPPADENIVYRVSYAAERVRVTQFLESDDGREVLSVVTTKASGWGYEREWRAFKSEVGQRLHPFRPQMLSGVVLGARISSENEKRVRHWCSRRSPKLNLWRAKLAATRFEMELELA